MDIKERLELLVFKELLYKNEYSSLSKLEKDKFYMIYDAGPNRGNYEGYIPMLDKKSIVKLSYKFHSIVGPTIYFYDMGPEGEEYIAFPIETYGKTWILGPSDEE